jgi:N-acetylneuraminic acid mutarotase
MKTPGSHARRLLGLTFRAWFGLTGAVVSNGPTALAQSQESTASWTATGSLNTARHAHTATLLSDGRVLVVGGLTEAVGPSNILTSAELYDPATGTWRVTGSLNVPRYLCSTTLLANGKVLVAGGYGDRFPPSFGITDTAEIYDPATETWSMTGRLNSPRAWHAATLQSSRVLILGGANGTSALDSAEIYDPETETWNPTERLVAARYGPTATLLQDGKVLIVAGSDDGDLTSTMGIAELYDPITRLWRGSGHLDTARISHSATRLSNGMVLVAGGYNWPPTSFASAELYDPADEKWTYTGRLRQPRDSHTALLLPNGKVLVAGGYDWSRRARLDSSEIYDPPTGTWSDTANLNTARSSATATLLLNGKVLVAGGMDGASLKGAELYDPGTISGEAANAVP